MTPPQLDRVVKTCMAKDPDERWQTASDLCRELKWISDGGSQAGMPVPAPSEPTWKKISSLGSSIRGCGCGHCGGSAVCASLDSLPQRMRFDFTIGAPEKVAFESNPAFLSISPDGSKLAFVAGTGPTLMGSSGMSLWIRSLDSPAAQALPGTEGASQPFWSPDSQFVGFFAGGQLKKIAVSGGPPQTLSEAPSSNTAAASSTGGSWSRDGVILFTANFKSEVINRVSESGGAPTPVTTLDGSGSEIAHLWPQFLPDGKHFLYFSFGSAPGAGAIYAASLDSKERKLILNNITDAVYASSGYLLFIRQGTLMAQPFDAARLELGGEAVPVAEGVQSVGITGRAAFTVSDNGVLAYRGEEEWFL